LGQKIKDTLAFNQRVVAQNLQPLALQSFSNGVHSKRINHRAQTSQSKQTSILRTKHQSKESFKERTKG
jgi:hypothetical protein